MGAVFKSVSLARVLKSHPWPQILQRMTLVAWEADGVHLAKFLHAQSGSIECVWLLPSKCVWALRESWGQECFLNPPGDAKPQGHCLHGPNGVPAGHPGNRAGGPSPSLCPPIALQG